MDETERAINKENFERFGSLQAYMQKAVQECQDVSMIVSNGEEGLKEGVAFLFLPPVVKLSKKVMMLLYNMTSAADEALLIAGETYRFRFIVNDVFTSGMSISELVSQSDNDDDDDNYTDEY